MITVALVSFLLGMITGMAALTIDGWITLKREKERVHQRRRYRDLYKVTMTPELHQMLEGISTRRRHEQD